MSTQKNAVAVIPPASKDAAVVVSRPLERILSDLIVSDDRVTIREGAKIKAEEFAEVIAHYEKEGVTLRNRARWTYYAAGKLPEGAKIQTEIVVRLAALLSKSALYQLKSEATTLCPLIEAEGIKSPMSILKDAASVLKLTDKGALAPLSKQNAAAKKLIPLLKAGTVKQKEVREIKAANVPAPKAGGTSKGPRISEADKAYASALLMLSAVDKYMNTEPTITGDDLTKLRNLATNISRRLGLVVTVAEPKK